MMRRWGKRKEQVKQWERGGRPRRWCDAENGAGVYRDGMNVCTSLCVRVGV